MKDVLVLGIESSCDETAAAVVKNGREVLANVVASQIDIHALYGGVVPEIASRNHVEAIDGVVLRALKEANVVLSDISAIAVTYGAGLVGALMVGVSYAKALSQASKIPLVAVNHVHGHICANYLDNPDLVPPYLCLLTSGGHTAVVEVKGNDDYNVLCSTCDDAVGECFDKVARVLGKPYPGGVYVDEMARRGKPVYNFKSVVLPNGNYSFSGLKTAVVNLVHNAKERGETLCADDVAASFTKTAIDGLVASACAQMEKSGLKTLALGGGVAANSYLRQQVKLLESKGVKVFMPQLKYCGDNGAMIASQGYFSFLKKDFADLSLTACPTLRFRAAYDA